MEFVAGRVVPGSMPTLSRGLSPSICWVVRSVTRARVDGLAATASLASAAHSHREHEGGSDARVAQTSSLAYTVKVEQRRVGNPRERVGVRPG